MCIGSFESHLPERVYLTEQALLALLALACALAVPAYNARLYLQRLLESSISIGLVVHLFSLFLAKVKRKIMFFFGFVSYEIFKSGYLPGISVTRLVEYIATNIFCSLTGINNDWSLSIRISFRHIYLQPNFLTDRLI